MQIRIPTNQEYDRLVEITDGDNAKMNWRDTFSWVNDEDGKYQLMASDSVLRGCYSDRYWIDYPGSYRREFVGFRPAADVLSIGSMDSDPEEGATIVMGTLYMDGRPIRVSETPVQIGDICQYKPGTSLEMREALDEPAYQVIGICVGNAVVADRVLVNHISYKDIELAIKPKLEISKILTLGTAHITEKTADMLAQESELNVMRLTVYNKWSDSEEYGWFIYLNDDPKDNGPIPRDLAACIKLAKDNGCGILCLDCEGPTIPILKTFSW